MNRRRGRVGPERLMGRGCRLGGGNRALVPGRPTRGTVAMRGAKKHPFANAANGQPDANCRFVRNQPETAGLLEDF